MMADHVPFDIQTIIIKKLPARSLLRFRCVSKQWKALIDSSEFIKSYKSKNDPHILVRYNVQQYDDDMDEYLSIIDEYVSIIDNDTFPQQMSPMTVPFSVKTHEYVQILGSSCGLICFYAYHEDHSEMVIFWNPSIRKSVSVPVRLGAILWVGFGVCPETFDPKLVKIDNVMGILEVHVYTLSTRAWKKVSVESPNELCRLEAHDGVCVEGFIYWMEHDNLGNWAYSIVSFDLRNDEFGKVCLPCKLQFSKCVMLSKWNGCLTLIDIAGASDKDHSFNIWVMKDDGVAKSFTILFHIEPMYPKHYNVLELRKNGEAIIETSFADNDDAPILQVYDPSSGRVADIGLPWSGRNDFGITVSKISISSYMETLLLLDH